MNKNNYNIFIACASGVIVLLVPSVTQSIVRIASILFHPLKYKRIGKQIAVERKERKIYQLLKGNEFVENGYTEGLSKDSSVPHQGAYEKINKSKTISALLHLQLTKQVTAVQILRWFV